jgi:hypothetical protein
MRDGRMQRATLATGVAVLGMFVSSCTVAPHTQAEGRSATSHPSPTPSPMPTVGKTFGLPHRPILVSLTKGEKDWKSPEFTFKEQAFTVIARCEGEGQIAIRSRSNKTGEKPTVIKCDRTPWELVVITDRKDQQITVEVDRGAAWEVGAFDGLPAGDRLRTSPVPTPEITITPSHMPSS